MTSVAQKQSSYTSLSTQSAFSSSHGARAPQHLTATSFP